MEAKFYEEMQSFLSKFTFLSAHGVNSTLSFNAFLGNVFVNLNADLGHVPPPPLNENHAENQTSTRIKPSKARRRRRRERERALNKKHWIDCDDDLVPGDSNCDEDENMIENAPNYLDDMSSLSDKTPLMANSSDLNVQYNSHCDNSTKATSFNTNHTYESKYWDQFHAMLKSVSESVEKSTTLMTSSSAQCAQNGNKFYHEEAVPQNIYR